MQTQCPWCERFFDAPPCHRHDDGDEYRCPCCGKRHTRKEGDPAAYVFFPGDIAHSLGNDITPLFGG